MERVLRLGGGSSFCRLRLVGIRLLKIWGVVGLREKWRSDLTRCVFLGDCFNYYVVIL